MFYVYFHRRLDNNEIFYVGKGKDQRAYSIKDRSNEWKQIYNKAGGRIVDIVFKNEDEKVILAYETFLIKTSLIWGDSLTNKTHGGEGKAGIHRTETQKEHLRQVNLGKKHKSSTIDLLKLRSQDENWVKAHKLATLKASNTTEAKAKHHNKQKLQYKPVVGTNVETGEEIYLDYMSQDPRFDPTMIRACILGKNGRTHHKGYKWNYATKKS